MCDEEIQAAKINLILAVNCGYSNVKEWLLGMGLGQYYDVFIENGYDSFRICSEIQKIDIHTIGIHDEYHKNILIKGVRRMNNPQTESVYHRLSVTTPDDNEFKCLANELNILPMAEFDHQLPNGHAPKLTEEFYKKKPTLVEKRAVRTKLVQLKIDLTDAIYVMNSPELDTLAEQIGVQLVMEELSVYDILCLLREMAINNVSPKLSMHKPVYKAENSSIDTPTTPDSQEDIFSPINSETAQPKPTMRPKKPPRAFTNPEEKPLLAHLPNGSVTSPPTSITTSDTVDWVTASTYDILHSDSLEPLVLPIVKSPSKMVISTKLDDVFLPPLSATSPSNTDEALYIDLNDTVITENSIGTPVKSKSISNSIFKRAKGNSKKTTEDSIHLKKPPNQPPPPPPISVPAEAESSGRKNNEFNDAKVKKQSGFFKRSVKPKTETKARNKKSKDESDLIKECNESETVKPLSKIISKSTDNLSVSAVRDQFQYEELNNVGGKIFKQGGFSLLSQEANEELLRKKLLSTSDQPTKQNSTDEESSLKYLPPNPVPRRRNSPEETQLQINNPKSPPPAPDQFSREELNKYIHTLPRTQKPESKAHLPPKKPKRNISDELIYNNVEQPIPNPVPRVRKIDSPPLSAKSDMPPMGFPQRSHTVSSRPQNKPSTDTTQFPKDNSSTANQVRLKPEIPKGKKPVLKSKPALEGALNKKDKSVSDPRTNQNRYEDKMPALSGSPSTARTNSPLTAPLPPSTKRPVTPSNKAPEPPPIHSIPTMRPVAHVRPTKPPISNSAVYDPRSADNWKKIEDKIYDILDEEDFICYLVTHYSRENGESCITPGLVSRLANKTSFAIHHIAFALDNIRSQKLTELGKNSVPISLAEFDEMQIPICIDSIAKWLTEIGLPNYIDVFEENVNSTNEIKNLDADDLSEFCISTQHRGYLLQAIEMLQ